MFWRLLALFTIVPLIELALLIWVGSLIGVWPTIGIVLATGIAGTILARREGIRAWRNVQETLAAGRMPADELLDALLIVVAGALLVTPGTLTDLTGLSLLIPAVRTRVRAWLRKKLEAQITVQTGVYTLDPDDVHVVESDAEVIE